MSLLQDFVNDSDRVALYRSWIGSPIAREVIDILRETFLRPALPGEIKSPSSGVTRTQSAEFCLGENAGAWKMFDALRELDRMLLIEEDKPLEETYGVKEETTKQEKK